MLTHSAIDTHGDNGALIAYVKQVLTETESHKRNIMDNMFWQWQHNLLPGERAHVYQSMFNNKIAGYYHVPIYNAMINGEKGRLAMIQDVAVDSNIRGQGVFRQLATFANADIDTHEYDAIYTFPNNKSKHTFIKYNGFTEVASLSAYVMPIDISMIIKSKINIPSLWNVLCAPLNFFLTPPKNNLSNIVAIAQPDQALEQLYSVHSKSYKFFAERNTAFLSWRFTQRPHSQYFLFGYKTHDSYSASCVVKIDNMMGTTVMLLMDYAYTDAKQFEQLLHYVATHSLQLCGSKIALLFTALCDKNFNLSRPSKFIAVAPRYNPRLLNLLIRPLNYKGRDLFDAHNWFVTLADWDVF